MHRNRLKNTEVGARDLPEKPHALTVPETARLLQVDLENGVPASQVAARRALHGRNDLRRSPAAGVMGLLFNQVRSPVVALLTVAAALAFTLGQEIDGAAIVAVLAINTLIGFTTELRAVRSMEALHELSAQSVRVRRDCENLVVPASDLVPGDIVILDAGDIIAADMRVLNTANLASDESALTGESLPVAKAAEPVAPGAPLPERASMIFKGCAVTRGTGEGLVTATGMETEIGHIASLVEKSAPESSPLERQLQRLGRDLVWITLGVVLAVGLAGILAGEAVALMVETAIALAVAAIPEGLPIVATLTLARGMLRMARHNALVERLSAVETLGATTVILTDKTGTLTENRMHVDRILTSDGEIEFDRHNSRFLRGGSTLQAAEDTGLAELLRAVALCSNADLKENGRDGTGDPMEIALLQIAQAGGLRRKDLLARHPELTEHAFDVETKMMATVHEAEAGNLFAVKGAPEAIFDAVGTVDARDGPEIFDAAAERHWRQHCDLLAAEGLRTIAVAGKTADVAHEDPYADLTLFGIVALQDPPRHDITAALADARRAGIRVIMATGDHAKTAASIARKIGLAAGDAKAIGGAELKPLDRMSEAERREMRDAAVFSRVTPQQKLDLVALHQEAGEIVAMTGDGVNDAPALKKADIGIAMGQRGTQVAREAAAMVLRDDAFSTIILAVREGRAIYANIRRFTTYLLSCNLSEILIVGLAVLFGLPLPLLPLQILFLNLVTDVFPAFALGTIGADRGGMERPPRDPGAPLLAKAQWRAIVVYAVIISGVTLASLVVAKFWFGLRGDELTTASFFTLALAQLWHVFNMRNWRDGRIANELTQNFFVWLAIAICIALLLAAAFEPHTASVLRIAPLPLPVWAMIFGLSVVPVVLRELAAAIQRRLSGEPAPGS